MGIKQIGLLLMVFPYLHLISSASPIQQAPVSDHLHHNYTPVNKRGAGARGSGGKGPGISDGGENGAFRTPGTANFVPVYATAGAANNHHPRHNAASDIRNQIGIRAISASVLLLLGTYNTRLISC